MRKYSIRGKKSLHEVFQSLEMQKKKQHADNSFKELISRIENKVTPAAVENNDLTWENLKRELYRKDDSINKMTPRLLDLAINGLNLDFKKTRGSAKKEEYVDFLNSKNVSLDEVVDIIIFQRKNKHSDISKRDLTNHTPSTEAHCPIKSDPGDSTP